MVYVDDTVLVLWLPYDTLFVFFSLSDARHSNAVYGSLCPLFALQAFVLKVRTKTRTPKTKTEKRQEHSERREQPNLQILLSTLDEP